MSQRVVRTRCQCASPPESKCLAHTVLCSFFAGLDAAAAQTLCKKIVPADHPVYYKGFDELMIMVRSKLHLGGVYCINF
jgi:hypothetical protein